jgi:DNA polymerase (family 10)
MDSAIDKGIVSRDMGRFILSVKIEDECSDHNDDWKQNKSKDLSPLVRFSSFLFHVHSAYSDGTKSIKTMVEAAKSMGLSYMGLSDHSQSAVYAGGMTAEKLRIQSENQSKGKDER